MTEPTEQQAAICAALARAIWPGAEITESQFSGVDVLVYDKLNETRSWYGFNPFTDVAASRALVAWLAADDARWFVFYEALAPSLSIPVFQIGSEEAPKFTNQHLIAKAAMTAPLAVIAMAAHSAITE